MQTLYVELGERRYPIFIGSDLDPNALLEPYIHGRQVMIVSNEMIAPLYLARYVAAIEALGKTVATCILPDGEKYKNIEKLENWISPLIWLSINVIIITLLYFEPMPKKFIGLILIYPLNLIFYDIFSEFILHLLFKIFTSGLSKSAVDKFLYEVYIKSGEIKRVTEIREFYIKVNNKINESQQFQRFNCYALIIY